jgi:hypothetical protein
MPIAQHGVSAGTETDYTPNGVYGSPFVRGRPTVPVTDATRLDGSLLIIGTMAEPSEETVRMVERLLDALAELRTTTRTAESDVRRALKMAQKGSDLATAVVACNPAGTRQAMNDALNTVEVVRHQMRLKIFQIGLEEGMTIGELGRAFGFSRQLASRIAKEARSVA